jgi:hypothetical protein
MFDAEMVAVSLLKSKQLKALERKRTAVLKLTRGLFDDPRFEEAVRTGTNTPARLRYRIGTLTDALISIS